MPFDLTEVMASDGGQEQDEEKVRSCFQGESIEAPSFDTQAKQRFEKATARAGGALWEDDETCNWRKGFPKTPLPEVPFDLGADHTLTQNYRTLSSYLSLLHILWLRCRTYPVRQLSHPIIPYQLQLQALTNTNQPCHPISPYTSSDRTN